MPDEATVRPKACIVQYNASRYLARVDRAARTLADDGWDVVLVAIKDDETEAFEDRGDYVVKRVELTARRLPRVFRPLRWIEAVWRTYRVAVAERADVYNARDIYPLLVCWLAAKARGAAFIYDSDELNLYRNWPWAQKRWWKTLAKSYEGFFIKRSDANITSDEGRADILQAEYGIARPTVVRNVPLTLERPDPDADFRAQALGDARHLLLYAGILVPNRGLLELVDAMAALPECALAFVGYGHLLPELEARIAERELGSRVRVFDAVPYETMLRYTAAADAALVPIVGSCLSYRHAAPNKLFEAMMVGVPVVASDLPDMARVVREERAGTLIGDPTDPESIVSAVRELLDGDEPLSVIGSRAREAAIARHNWELEREGLLGVWRALRGEGAR